MKTERVFVKQNHGGHPPQFSFTNFRSSKAMLFFSMDEALIPTFSCEASEEISAYRLSMETFLPQTRISEVIKGNRSITADTALRCSKFFGTSAKFWLGLQDDYDLEEEKNRKESELDNIKPIDDRAV